MERLSILYKQFVGSEPTEIVLMDKAGSNRQYYRMHGERSIVGVIGESREENDAFKKRKHQFMALDTEGRDVFLADSNYVLQMAQQDFPKITFHFTSEF